MQPTLHGRKFSTNRQFRLATWSMAILLFLLLYNKSHGQNSLQGALRYDNNSQTPLAGVPVRLLNPAGLPVAFDTTDSQGNFQLSDFPSSTYTFVAQIGYPWGGVNSTDALNAQRSFSNQQVFSPFRNRAADVNGNGVLNSTDAIQISRRVSLITGAFAVGNYLWDPSLVVAQGSPIQRNFLVLCTGDINGSYPISPTQPSLSIDSIHAVGYTTRVGVRFDLEGSGVFARGICWSALPNPNNLDSVLLTGRGGFGFHAYPPGLTPGRNWYLKGFAQNSAGIYYTAEVVVTPVPVAPEMSTDSVTQVTSGSARVYGQVVRDGGQALVDRGFCYDTTTTPLLLHGVVQAPTLGPDPAFSGVINGLRGGRTYYVRSYGTHAAGTGYGLALSFYTPPGFPQLNTGAAAVTGAFSGRVTGSVVDEGGSPVTARGICWASGRVPTTADDTTINGTGAGTFTGTLSRLSPATTYQARAYGTNAIGTAYGGVVVVTTPNAPYACGTPVMDTTGFVYPTVQIGGQCWTATNLRTAKYRNGDAVPGGLDSTAWSTTQQGAWAVNSSEPQFEVNYGKLYNAHAALDPRGLCPTGWRVATDPDWQALVQFLQFSGYDNGSTRVDGAGFALKSCRQLNGGGPAGCSTADHPRWNSHNLYYGADSYGFAALPGGSLSSSGATFTASGGTGSWWCATPSGSSAWYVQLSSTEGNLSRTTGSRQNGRSVRCVRVPDTSGSMFMPPSIYSLTPTGVGTQSAQLAARISGDGGAPVTSRGFCWNGRPLPTRNNARVVLGSDTGLFSYTLSGLAFGTYFVRAFAENAAGIAYSNSVQFTTLPPQGGNACNSATVTDVEGQTYETVAVGSQCWMKTNLRTRRYNNNDTLASLLWRYQQNIPGVGTTALYNNDMANLPVYGRLYSYTAATDARGLCPTGWHLPSQGEWNVLAQFAGDTLHAGIRLKGAVNWSGAPAGTNAHGLGILPGGIGYNDNVFSFLGTQAHFWACDSLFTDALGGNYRQVWFDRTPNLKSISRLELHALSVRCLQNATVSSVNAVLPYLTTAPITGITQISAVGGGRILSDGGAPISQRGVCWSTARNPTTLHSTSAAGGGTGAFNATLSGLNAGTWYYVRAYATNAAGTGYGAERMFHTPPPTSTFTCGTDSVQDLSGFRYATVLLGTQCWTKSHLRTFRYTNGDSVLLITDSVQWKNTTSGAWSAYQNDLQYEQTYGKLYNWYAIADPRKLCPLGWHVPTNTELTALINFAVSRGYSNTSSNVNGAGSALKSCRQVSSPLGGACNTSDHPRWNSHTTHRGTDALGLSILPAGARSGDDGQFSSLSGYCLLLSSTLTTTDLVQGQYFRNSTGNIAPASGTKPWGGSVRCIKD